MPHWREVVTPIYNHHIVPSLEAATNFRWLSRSKSSKAVKGSRFFCRFSFLKSSLLRDSSFKVACLSSLTSWISRRKRSITTLCIPSMRRPLAALRPSQPLRSWDENKVSTIPKPVLLFFASLMWGALPLFLNLNPGIKNSEIQAIISSEKGVRRCSISARTCGIHLLRMEDLA